MAFAWFRGKKGARAGGRNGVIVILADVSSSMPMSLLISALGSVARAVPSARVFVFADTVAEAPDIRSGGGVPCVGGGTQMDRGLAAVAELRPQLTVVLSDGCVGDDQGACLAIADAMTGAISTLWLGHSNTNVVEREGRAFMAELARRSGGQFREYDLARGANVLAQEMIRIVHKPRIHSHELPPVIVHEGHPQPHDVGFAPTTVRVRRGGR